MRVQHSDRRLFLLRKVGYRMNIEELRERLESITGNSPIDNARRLAIIAQIERLMAEQA